jgi:uncharacterized membrane protein (UPF0127 family)
LPTITRSTAQRALALAAVALAASLAGCGEPSGDALPTVTIGTHAWKVEVADTPELRQKGLSGRTALADDRGMIFVFSEPGMQAFYMKGCYISLDIAFIDENRRVLNVLTMYKEDPPEGRELYYSAGPAMYALETPAGALVRAGVKPGDEVRFSPTIPLRAKPAP